MSDYFGALMRATGLPIAGQAPSATLVDPQLRAVDAERPSVGPPLRSINADDVPTDAAPKDGTDLPTAREPTAMSPMESSTPMPGPARVRVAMEWVAADPGQARDIPDVGSSDPQSASPRGDTQSRPGIAGTHRARGSDSPPQAATATTHSPAASDLVVLQPTSHRAFPTDDAALPALATRPAPLAPHHHDEVVEISIGAIHLRVDAPAVQTVARPATSAPAAEARVTSATHRRSSLSRRALRRI